MKLAQGASLVIGNSNASKAAPTERPAISRTMQQKLTQLNVEVLPHPPHSPDRSPTDYHFFQVLDLFMRPKVYANADQVENAFQKFVDSRDPSFYYSMSSPRL